uniref:Chromosome 20 open reading frame 96 n=1 Tax=Oryctolagus cuniculus TaxID=9986 RepID=A0A5F9DE11_RABIT
MGASSPSTTTSWLLEPPWSVASGPARRAAALAAVSDHGEPPPGLGLVSSGGHGGAGGCGPGPAQRRLPVFPPPAGDAQEPAGPRSRSSATKSATLAKLNDELLRIIQDVEDSTALNVRELLHQQDTLANVVNILEYSNKRRLQQLKSEIQEWEEKENQKMSCLERQVQHLEAQNKKTQDQVNFLSTYMDHEYPVKLVQLASLGRQVQQAKDRQQAQITMVTEEKAQPVLPEAITSPPGRVKRTRSSLSCYTLPCMAMSLPASQPPPVVPGPCGEAVVQQAGPRSSRPAAPRPGISNLLELNPCDNVLHVSINCFRTLRERKCFFILQVHARRLKDGKSFV